MFVLDANRSRHVGAVRDPAAALAGILRKHRRGTLVDLQGAADGILSRRAKGLQDRGPGASPTSELPTIRIRQPRSPNRGSATRAPSDAAQRSIPCRAAFLDDLRHRSDDGGRLAQALARLFVSGREAAAAMPKRHEPRGRMKS